MIAKVDADGNLLWTKTIGGSGNEYGQSIISAPNGNFVLTGSTESNNGDITGNHGASDLLLIEIESDGTIVWQKCLGGTGNDRQIDFQRNRRRIRGLRPIRLSQQRRDFQQRQRGFLNHPD